MFTKPISGIEIGEYSFDISFSKRRAGNLPLFNLVGQISPTTADLITTKGSFDNQDINLHSIVSLIEVVWGLNANPFVRVVLSPPPDNLYKFLDFPGFTKNNVLGVKISKESLNQSSSWIYGVTQYAVPRLDEKRRSILVDGYGLLFESSRRHVSRNFYTMTAQNIIATIAKKYGLDFSVVGSLADRHVKETEQNISDFDMICDMSMFLGAFWFLKEHALLLVGWDYVYNQKPEYTLFFSRMEKERNLDQAIPIIEFIPQLDSLYFPPGAAKISVKGIDLDSGKVIEEVFTPSKTRLGSLSLNSEQFFSDDGVTINTRVLRPSPKMIPVESGVYLPLCTRSNDVDRYRYIVEKKDAMEVCVLARVPGFPQARPGMVIHVEGVGSLLSGNYLVDCVTHKIANESGYVTDLLLIRNAICQIQNYSPFQTNLKEAPVKQGNGSMVFAETVEEN